MSTTWNLLSRGRVRHKMPPYQGLHGLTKFQRRKRRIVTMPDNPAEEALSIQENCEFCLVMHRQFALFRICVATGIRRWHSILEARLESISGGGNQILVTGLLGGDDHGPFQAPALWVVATEGTFDESFPSSAKK